MPVYINDMPTWEELKKCINYDPHNGTFLAKVGGKAGWKIGEPIGFIDRGYLRIRINKKYYAAHRIAWQIIYGNLQKNEQIDHIDGNRSNNKIINLRLAKHGDNCQNIKKPKNNKSGYKGVHFDSRKKKWRSQIKFEGKRHYLGYFLSKEDAYIAYCNASKKLHKNFSNFG